MAGWTKEQIDAFVAEERANQKLPCSRAGCDRLRHFSWKFCEAHAKEVMARRKEAGRKASATRRERYPNKYYQPGEKKDFRWQQFCQGAVHRAKASGVLPDLSTGEYACTDCGGVAVQYDHRDYARPLDVEPVCRSCNLRRGKAKFPEVGRFQFRRLNEEAA